MSTASDAPRPGPQRLSDQVAAHLVGRILRGELQPGFRLNEVELSKDLGVSRAPLREAIANLGQQGLVVITPYRGAVVPQLTEEELQETREIRAVLERLAVEVAFKRSPTLDTTELRAQLDAMRAAAHGGDTVAAALAHVELHRAIARLSEWPQLIAFLDLLIARSLALQGLRRSAARGADGARGRARLAARRVRVRRRRCGRRGYTRARDRALRPAGELPAPDQGLGRRLSFSAWCIPRPPAVSR